MDRLYYGHCVNVMVVLIKSLYILKIYCTVAINYQMCYFFEVPGTLHCKIL